MKIRFHKKLYKDGISNRRISKIIKMIRKGKIPVSVFLITLPLKADGILEVYWYPELMQTVYQKMDKELVVVGIANQRQEAFELIRDMVSDMMEENKNISVKEFFEEYS